MREVNGFGKDYNYSFKKSADNLPGFNEILKKFQGNLLKRCEREVPENGIFTPVKETFEHKHLPPFITACEYSENQTSGKKEKRVLKVYFPALKQSKENEQILFEGTKKEILEYLKKTKLTDNIIFPKIRNSSELYPHAGYMPVNIRNNVSFGTSQPKKANDNPEKIKEKTEKIKKAAGLNISPRNLAEIMQLDDDRFEKMIELLEKRESEDSYKKTHSLESYHSYCYSYLYNLLEIMQQRSPFYEQSLEFLENGLDIEFTVQIPEIELTDKQKERVYDIDRENKKPITIDDILSYNLNLHHIIYPSAKLLSLDNDIKFGIAKRIIKEWGHFSDDREFQIANEFGADEKIGADFIKIYDKYINKNKQISGKFKPLNTNPPELDIIYNIAKSGDETVKKALNYIDKGFNIHDIENCIKFDLQDKDIERAKSLLLFRINHSIQIASNDTIYGRYIQLSKQKAENPADIAVDDKKFERYSKYIKQGLSVQYASAISCMDEQLEERAIYLASHETPVFRLKTYCEDESFDKVKFLIEHGCSSGEISYLFTTDNEKWNKTVVLINLGVNKLYIDTFLKDDANYQKAKTLLERGFSSYDVYFLVNLDENKYTNVIEYINQGYTTRDAITLAEATDEEREELISISSRGIELYDAKQIMQADEQKKERIIFLLENGIQGWQVFSIAEDDASFEKQKKELLEKQNPVMKDFLNSPEYPDKIKKYSQGKYQKEIMEMFNPKTIPFSLKGNLIQSKLTEEDFCKSLQIFSKSTFKLAYDTPNQYLSNIDIKYTEKVNGKYPDLPEIEKIKERKDIKNFFCQNMGAILRALKYLDTDTVNQMMDKRTNIFRESLYELDSLKDDNYQILSDLIKCKSAQTGKILTAKEKIQFCQIVEMFQKCDIDTNILKNMAQTGIADINEAKRIISKEILEYSGFTDVEAEELSYTDLGFNPEYMYTILMKDIGIEDEENIKNIVKHFRALSPEQKQARIESINDFPGISPEVKEIIIEIYRNPEKYSDEEMTIMIKNIYKKMQQNNDIYVVTKHAVLGDFNEFINDTSNKYGQSNEKTKQAYSKNNIDINEWLNPTINDIEFDLKGKSLKVKMWKRNPKEDLFIGNKTSCCTAIGTGGNGAATPAYLLNHSYNVVELFDENNNAVGMSRIFMANIDNKPSVIMDNIEINQNFIKILDEKEKEILRNSFFKYMNNLAQKVTGDKNSQVYFSTKFAKLKTDDLDKKEKNVNFIGDISQESIYLNLTGGWIEYKNIQENPIELYLVPKN